jgi:cell division protein FtsW (lipid II flippase)
MIILGIIVLVVGFLLGIHLLWILGIALLVIGLILLALGYAGHPVGSRRHYWLCTSPSTACGSRVPPSQLPRRCSGWRWRIPCCGVG